ncbi:MAG: dUTP diphosphatase [Candidatus Symbiobacter sp.]|nr:dUTP diphosphatase [Candidatus Symbiobacter sp.]
MTENPTSLPSPLSLIIPLQALAHGTGLPLPGYATPGAAGLDLAAAITAPVILAPRQRRLIPTGFALALPVGYEAQIRPRSGLAVKHGVTVLNSPGTIDSDYRGEIKVLLINLGDQDVTIAPGDRIAQMVIQAVCRVEWQIVTELSESVRGEKGFGSTGISTGVKPSAASAQTGATP